MRFGDHVRELYGPEAGRTTNNRMELTAAIQALEALTRPAAVQLYTDSMYLHGGITTWLPTWKSAGWKTAGNRPVIPEGAGLVNPVSFPLSFF